MSDTQSDKDSTHDLGNLGYGREETICVPTTVWTFEGPRFEMVEVPGRVWDLDAPPIKDGESLTFTTMHRLD